jgi:hypothetical protein
MELSSSSLLTGRLLAGAAAMVEEELIGNLLCAMILDSLVRKRATN